jgi:hypothetical protein
VWAANHLCGDDSADHGEEFAAGCAARVLREPDVGRDDRQFMRTLRHRLLCISDAMASIQLRPAMLTFGSVHQLLKLAI